MPNPSRGFRAVVEAALSQRARVLALMFSVRKKKNAKILIDVKAKNMDKLS